MDSQDQMDQEDMSTKIQKTAFISTVVPKTIFIMINNIITVNLILSREM